LTCLYTDHLLETVLGFEITHTFYLFRPWIPNNYAVEIVSCDLKDFLAAFTDVKGLFWASCGSVDSVSLPRDGEFIGGLGLGGDAANFVDVLAVCEAGDGDFVNVLMIVLAKPPGYN
jgi:hypothetical protein